MDFATPIWLLGLLPWAALTLWVLWGRPQRVDVPYLELWRGPATPPRAKRGIEPPPLWLAACLGAILLAILAAAGLRIRLTSASGPPITILYDRSLTSAAGFTAASDKPNPADAIAIALLDQYGTGPVDFLPIPDAQIIKTDRSNWSSLPPRQLATPLDTRPAMQAAIQRELARSDAPIIVLSAQERSITDPRVAWLPPAKTIENIGIVRFALRHKPWPQVLLRVRNQSSKYSASVEISGGEVPLRQKIVLPLRDTMQDYFFDLPNPSDAVSVRIDVNDDIPADNVAWLARQGNWPKLEPMTTLPPELSRMLDVYAKYCPPREGSRPVAVVGGLFQIPKNQPAVGVLSMHVPSTANIWEKLQVRDHPLTAGVDWKTAATDASMGTSPGDDWIPLVSMGDRVLFAIREQPVRQAWVGFFSLSWPQSTDYVVFFSNLFTWLGEGGESYAAGDLSSLNAQWKPLTPATPSVSPSPGLYQGDQGIIRAFNSLDVRIEQHAASDWRTELRRQLAAPQRFWPAAPSMSMGACFLLFVTAISWRKRRLTPPVTSRTV